MPAEQAFAAVRRIGGDNGWYFANGLWHVRGFLDSLTGGVGLRRGRRDPETPAVGSTLDFWRVEAYEPDRLLRLRAEMRVPGRAWLQFEAEDDTGGSCIRQTALFDPVGLAGLAYWYALLPLHKLVFAGMLAGIAREAEGTGTATFEYRHTVSRGIGETFALFADPANLSRLTPPLLRFRIVQRPPRLARGSRFRYRVGPLTWVAEITEWTPPHRFADVQRRGPYRVWRHRHELNEVTEGTEVCDRVEYQLRGGVAARPLEPLHRAFLRALFAYRSRRLDDLLG